jgi:hypothetical protein
MVWTRVRTCVLRLTGRTPEPDDIAAGMRKRGPAGNREFVMRLVKRFNCRRVAEIGVWKGDLSHLLLREAKLDHLLLVDPLEQSRNLFVSQSRGPHPAMMEAGVYNCRMGEDTLTQAALDEVHRGLVAELERDYPGRTKFLRLPSLEAAPLVADGSLDLVFIDAVHLYEDVLADIRAWLPKVAPNGVLAGDDYQPAFRGLIAAVNESFPAQALRVHGETGIWYVHKSDVPDGKRGLK